MKKESKKRLRNKRKANIINTFDNCIDDLFRTDSVQKMKDIKHHLNLTCLDHSLFVSYVSYRICRLFNWDYKSAARGGLLHDMFLYDWRKKETPEGWHGTVHPGVALENAELLCLTEDGIAALNEIEKDMIANHMWPLTPVRPACRESMLVCVVDKICAVAEMSMIFQILKFKSRYFELASHAV